MQFCVPGISPPCNKKGEYFVADQVWIKFDEIGDVVDMVIIDAKLSASTVLTSGQNAAKNNIGGTIPKKIVEPIQLDAWDIELPSNIEQGLEIKILNFYKAIGDGVTNFVDIID